MYLVHKTPLKKTKIQPLPFTDIVSRACIILKNSKKNTSQPPPVYSLSTRDLCVVDTPRSESRLSYDRLDSKRGIEGKKKRLHASPLSLDGETTLDERDGFLRSAPLPFFYAVIHPPPHPLELIIQLGNSRWLGFLELFRGSLYASRPQPAPFYALLLLLLLPSPLRA